MQLMLLRKRHEMSISWSDEFLEKLGDNLALDNLITDPRRCSPEGTPNNSTQEGKDCTTFHEEVERQKLVRKDR
jgi:hypothetical protein